MEVAIGSNGNSPFQREVREWQRVDPNTGALLTGRLEADRWINGPLNAYGKVVDSQNLSQPNGTQHTQRKQFEVLQARTSSGSLQVVRAQTVQTSSSRWSSSSTKQVQSSNGQRFSIPLQITNGHHGSTNGYDDLFNHQNHQFMTEPSLKLSTLMRSSTASSSGSRSSPLSPSLGGSSSTSQRHHHDAIPSDGRYRPTSVVADDRVGGGSQERETSDAEHLQRLHRGRSISNDDLAIADWDQNDNNGSESSEWRRVSKIRRSFQFPKSTSPKPSPARPLDLPESLVSVSRIRQELENGRRLSTAMRNNHVDLAALDNILNGSPETEMKSTKKTSFLTAESLKEIRGKLKKLSDESLYKEDFITQSDIEKAKGYDDCPQEGFTLQKPVVLQDSHLIQQPSYQTRSKPEDSHNTNSLENRARHRDTSSAEWHLRRKSYGFEKMAPQSSSMFRQETSTDSGIGRSGDLNSWSPTEGAPRGTIITFGEASSSAKSRVAQMNNHQLVRRYKDTQEAYDSSNDTVEIKRHSIAVDESKYVRDNLRKVFDAKTSIHLNGFYSKEMNSSQSSAFDESGKRHRRVEFCKTEVHFAAESGRVNIVETDGKPPPTNNFRRRRRSSGGAITSAYMEAINSGRPVTHFGDDRKLQFDLDTTVEEILPNGSNVTVITNGGPDVIVPCTVQEEDEDQFGDEISIRGILKNKPVKPKPYHLGENIENSESLWGVRLRPVSGESVPEKSDEPTTVAERRDVSSASNSVAERVRIVEERKDGAGYSTKINLNLSNSPYSWEAPDSSLQSEVNKPIQFRLDDRRKSTQFEILNDSLKSTSLIMKTMRSKSHYEESQARLNLSEEMTQSHLSRNVSSRLISNMNSISKSSSANSIFFDNTKPNRQQYTSSLDGDMILNDDESSSHSSKIVSSSSFSSTSSSSFQYERTGTNESQIRPLEVLNEELIDLHQAKKPVAAPRIKIIGSSNAVSHQLSQLRRMYDAAEMESDDSARADEEVKLYLGNGTTTSVEEKTAEISGSWSRIKAKRASIKQTKDDLKELPKSNVMSIELHSPTVTLQRTSKEAVVSSCQDVPVAKPRNIHSVKTQSIKNEKEESTSNRTESSRKTSNQKAPLKIENGGTRKLKDHELLYFGVKLSNEEQHTNKINQSNIENNRKSATNNEHNTQKWKLSSDKPDLLRHSPIITKVSHSKKTSTTKNGTDQVEIQSDNKGPIYENLKKSSSYNRSKDVQRDQMILNEMTQEADQALKAISSDKSKKDHQRRTPQRSAKPLDTIDERRSSKLRQQPAKIVAARQLGDSYYRQCCSNRSSSVSSTESLSRLTGSTRSKDASEYINMQASKKRSPIIKDCIQKPSHRSSSRDTQRTNASSSEDIHSAQNNNNSSEAIRRSRRIKPKEKEKIVLKVDEQQRITQSTVRTDDRTKSTNKISNDSTKASLRSTKGDKHEKTGTIRSKVSSTRSSSDSRKMSRSKACPGIVSTSSSSKRSSRDHTRK